MFEFFLLQPYENHSCTVLRLRAVKKCCPVIVPVFTPVHLCGCACVSEWVNSSFRIHYSLLFSSWHVFLFPGNWIFVFCCSFIFFLKCYSYLLSSNLRSCISNMFSDFRVEKLDFLLFFLPIYILNQDLWSRLNVNVLSRLIVNIWFVLAVVVKVLPLKLLMGLGLLYTGRHVFTRRVKWCVITSVCYHRCIMWPSYWTAVYFPATTPVLKKRKKEKL